MQGSVPICSGASPGEVEADLQPLVDFQDEGLPLDTLKQMLEKRLLPHLMRYEHPGFQSMFNTFPEEGARLGGEISLDFNQGVTNWQVSPGGAMLEELCCKALCRLFGFSPDSDATMMYCGTYANRQALYMAIHRKAEREGFDFADRGVPGFADPGRLAVVVSRDAHFSLKHAVRMMGLGEQCLVPVDVDANRCIDVQRMKDKLTRMGPEKEVFCVVATAGTTSTGSVDPVFQIAELCEKHGSWLHVDGAYGLAYSLIPEKRSLFKGMELADSVSWDPHKQFRVPIPSSVLFARRGEDFNRMALHSDYFNRPGDVEPNPGLKSAPSTRPFSALPLVTAIRHQGMEKIIRNLRAPLEAVEALAGYLDGQPDMEVFHKPHTGILCFRIVPEGLPQERLDGLQTFIYDRIMKEGKRTVSTTRLDDRNVLRLVAVSPSVTVEALKETISEVRALAREYSS